MPYLTNLLNNKNTFKEKKKQKNMIKKLFSFIFCLVPVGAMAATVSLKPTDNSADIILPDDTEPTPVYPEYANGLVIGASDNSAIVENNDNGVLTKSLTVNNTTNGIDVAGGLIVGTNTGAETGWLYILKETSAGTSNGFTIKSTGPIKFGSLLQVENGNFLRIGETGSSDARIAMTLGSGTVNGTTGIAIDNSGKLDLTNISTFTAGGTIRNNTNATSLTIDATAITSASISNMGGTMDISAGTGALNAGTGVITSSDNAILTKITAGNLTSGDIQNGAGTMTINLTGNLTSSGNVENQNGTSMTITAKDMTVAGTMTNSRNDGTMTITADNLTINGGNATNASFVNGGNLYITVTGATKLANGFDFSTMQKTNVFSLTTGTLDTTTASSDNWLHMFSNKLNSFTVNITNGALSLATTDIINGQAYSTNATGEINTAANMDITAQSVSAKSVRNIGQNLNITAKTGTVNITDGVTTTTGTTNIVAATTVTASNVTNSAKTLINGTTGTTTGNVINNTGGTLDILSSTASTGKINTGTITNNGTLNLQARQITTGALTNESGTTNITGSDVDGDALTMGTVTASGGVINIKSLIGDITVNGDLLVQKTQNGGGSLNIEGATKSLTATGTVAIDGDMTLSSSATAADGAMNIVGSGVQNFVMTAGQNMTVGGDIIANETGSYRTAQLVADNIKVEGDVTVANGGRLQFGSATNKTVLTIDGSLTADTPASNGNDTSNGKRGVEIYSKDNQVVTVGDMSGDGLFIIHGSGLTATRGDIDISNNIMFDGSSTASNGLVILDTNAFTLTTINAQSSIYTGGISLASGNTLTLDSAKNITVAGTVADNGNLKLNAKNGTAKLNNAITVATTGSLSVDAQTINMNDITNNNTAELVATHITTGAITANAGTMDITAAQDLTAGPLTVKSGAIVNISSPKTTVAGPVIVSGNMIQDTNPSAGALNLTSSGTFNASSLQLTGNFIANNNQTVYTFDTFANISGNITVNSGMVTMMANAGKISAASITNHDTLSLTSTSGIDISTGTIMSDGDLTLNSGTGLISAKSTNLINGRTTVTGRGLSILEGYFTQNILRQNYNGILGTGDMNIMADNYTIWANGGAQLGGIAQESGSLTLSTSDLQVTNNINATDLRIVANPGVNWLTVKVGGDVSGNTKFVGLQHMEIDGNYTYNSNSGLVMAIQKPTDAGRDYWADVSLNNDDTLGQITNRSPSGEPLISVNGAFITQLDNNLDAETGLLSGGKMGVQIFDIVDPGTAVWLLQARLGVIEEGTKIRNVMVQFCNADGTQCFNYLKPTVGINETGDDLPAYISVRDTTNDGVADSLYLVFDPRFGGPVEIFKIQPIVDREYDHTNGEYMSAGALDDLIAGRLQTLKFYNRTPIEAIPFIFRGTNMEQMAGELYNRMEYYEQTHNGSALARFSRLFQPREVEQLTASVALNEHTSFRDFEDHMFDEFIWNRNRKLRKAWGEFDFGMFNQRGTDSVDADGNRFSFTGGYDWQETETLILGLAGRVSHMSGNSTDDIDLSYKPGQSIAGSVDIDVADTNIGIGGYLMQNLGTKMRAYGNAFLDIHLLDVSRKQTYMSSISGDGTSFSLISEWGLLHDWLNQYIVGNAYARVGYNFGLSITEKAGGDDYMKLKSDGYVIFTPGYSLIAQKRIYPSPWFQIRPYASIGAEYDVLGTPDKAKYKFMAAKGFTKYDVEIDPLWANIGGGVELLSATGIQVGLDYRYQYNADIQMHKIKLSGSYRF